MSRYDNLISNLGKGTIFCNNLGFGEQGAVLAQMPKSIFVCPDIEQAHQMELQLDAINRHCVVVDDFNKPFTLAKFQSNENQTDLIKAMFDFVLNDAIIISTPQILFSYFCDIDTFSNQILKISKTQEYDLLNLEKKLVEIGYKKVESITTPGEFARRGDILDIFNVADDSPTRIDFFDTDIEEMYEFDFITFEKKGQKSVLNICPNKILNLSIEEKNQIISSLNQFSNQDEIILDLISALQKDEQIPLEFLKVFSDKIIPTFSLDCPIIISSNLSVQTKYQNYFEMINEKINLMFKSENLKNLFKNNKNFLKIDDFFEKNKNKLVFFENYDINSTELFNKFPEHFDANFHTINFPNFKNNLLELKSCFSNYKDKQIFLCLNSQETVESIKKIFGELLIPFSTNTNSKGIVLTTLSIPYNICFEDDEKFYIGSTNFAHKKEIKQTSKSNVKYLPKAGEYVVHSVHGIGKCEGITNVNVSGVEKEFFKIMYLGGDTLYVPVENADCLSLYMCDGSAVRLNKLGGKEFANQKQKALQSIEDMSKDLLELYAKRKASKGFVYPQDDYLYTEFEDAFEFQETNDQLQAIQDVKNDMMQGKVMDRLICGDVGFGKTEVAMRALFKAVESGKQVAILAPTTILSLQHFMSTQKRTKDFGVNVEMLNRFRTPKEQKQILADLQNGKINVICGTHRLLSSDVKFFDLGLLILDEEQRFGVKAKEHIKQLKNNVDVLTLSATPIPRTLSMTMMAIRDISVINTPPKNRLPVKTYVMAYNEDIVINAINDEIKRNGQVLVIYNNIENIYKFANSLKEKADKNAVFDVAHGQMSEQALENAIKRLYDKETNVFVSTTLIENGVDLPSANTLIVIDSDRLGLSQMYQLRGRVGRSDEQAYAYFTFNKNKTLTEEASSRLQAIAENTELGSGFKIAMRDLQIRGAGELLGKVQHGHMVKIGYDMYSKLLNDTLKKLKGEKVEIEREVKIDIAISSKIPYSFIEDETERLKIIAKISNITSKDSARKVLNDLLAEYGKLPKEIYQLANVSIIKAMATKQKIKQVTITKQKMMIVYYEDVDLNSLIRNVKKFHHFHFEQSALPTIALDTSFFSVQTGMNYIIEFLNNIS